MKFYGNLDLDGGDTKFQISTTAVKGSLNLPNRKLNNITYIPNSNINTRDGGFRINTDKTTRVPRNEIYISHGESNLINSAISHNRPTGNTGVIIAGSSSRNDIEYINIRRPSNSYYFGNLSNNMYGLCATSNGPLDRALVMGGWSNRHNHYYIMSISTGVDAAFFGYTDRIGWDRTATGNACSNRSGNIALVAGCSYSRSNISYKRIYSFRINTAMSWVHFGYLSYDRHNNASTSNSELGRGIFAGGSGYQSICWCPIQINGSSNSFGNLMGRSYYNDATSNGSLNRGLIMGNYYNNSTTGNVIQHISISSTGNAINHGDLTVKVSHHMCVDNNIQNRAVRIGGNQSATLQSMDYTAISYNNNAVDFGDLIKQRWRHGACSNG